MTSPAVPQFGPTVGGTSALPGSLQNPSSSTVPYIAASPDDNQLLPSGQPAVSADAPSEDGIRANMTLTPSSSSLTLGSAKKDFLQQALADQSFLLTTQQYLIDAGFLDPRQRSYHPGVLSVGDATYKAYVDLLHTSIASGTDLNTLLNSRAEQHLGDRFMQSTKTSTGSAVDLTNPSTVQTLLTDSMKRLLGRKPTPAEIASVTQTLNGLEQANPKQQSTTSSMTTSYSNGMPSGQDVKDSSSTTSGGLDPGQTIDNIVQNKFSDEADTHSVRGYADAFEKLIQGGAGKVV